MWLVLRYILIAGGWQSQIIMQELFIGSSQDVAGAQTCILIARGPERNNNARLCCWEVLGCGWCSCIHFSSLPADMYEKLVRIETATLEACCKTDTCVSPCMHMSNCFLIPSSSATGALLLSCCPVAVQLSISLHCVCRQP